MPNSSSAHPPPAQSGKGELAPWQVIKLGVFLKENVYRNVSVTELSTLVRLSAPHFARAFKTTFQATPHCYMLRYRIAHAQRLLASTATPLPEVALNSGFSDQAHLCKVFRRFVGATPAGWRRQEQRQPLI